METFELKANGHKLYSAFYVLLFTFGNIHKIQFNSVNIKINWSPGGGWRPMARGLLVVPQIDPSVPQSVVQSRRRPLLGPSPG